MRYKQGVPHKNKEIRRDADAPYSFKITIDNNSSVATTDQSASKSKSSVFSRLGNVSSSQQSGTAVVFENLLSSVTKEDIEELAKSTGEIKSINIKNIGKGKKESEVIFLRRSQALECVLRNIMELNLMVM